MKPDASRDELILVLTTGNSIYANMVKAALDEENIVAILKSAAGYHLRGMLPFEQRFFDTSLYVQKQFKSRADDIIRTIVPPGEIQ